jgi:hypothetical protein
MFTLVIKWGKSIFTFRLNVDFGSSYFCTL